jgi:hypothetical protein
MVETLEREEDEINLIVRKISKKWKDQPCNQEASSFQTLRSRIIKKHQVFRPFFYHPFRTSPGKSHFSHLSHHIFHLGRSPIIMRPLHIFLIFHLGRSPITMRPLHFFLIFHLGRSPITMRPLHIFSIFHLGRSPITMRPFHIFSIFHLGRSPIITRPLHIFSIFLGLVTHTMRPSFFLGSSPIQWDHHFSWVRHPYNETIIFLGFVTHTMRPSFFLG